MTLLAPEMWTRSGFRRAHRIDVFSRASLILRDITPGTWTIEGIPRLIRDASGAAVHNAAYDDLEAGGGIIVWYGEGVTRQVIFSGRVEDILETEELLDTATGSTHAVKRVSGQSDLAFIADRDAHPHPADLDFSAAATKTYNGVGETQLKALVNDNLGATAAASRKQANFAVAVDQGRGSTVNDAVRLDPMGDLVAGWSIRAGLVPSVLPVNGVLTFDVAVGTDRRRSVVFAVERANVSRVQRQVRAPGLTFEWVGGQGVGTARTFRSAEDAVTEATWGFRRESFRDRRDTADNTVLDAQAAADLLAKAGNTAIQVEPSDAGMFVYGVDYRLGDTVTVRMSSGLSIVKAIREVRVDLTPERIALFAPTVADPLTPGVDDVFVFSRVRLLENEAAANQAAT